MSQYDKIGSDYDLVKLGSFNLIERYNFQRIVQPFLQGPDIKVIDFACGTGFYSYLLFTWGASEVFGMDLSQVMIDGAIKRLSATPYASRAEFIQADATKPQRFRDEFDVATAVWLLNYAKNAAELTAMFRSVSENLKAEGVFVGLTFHPTDDLESFGRALSDHGKYVTGVQWKMGTEVADGYMLRAIMNTPEGTLGRPVELDTYHLRKGVHEIAARAAGLNGRLEWHKLEYLDDQWAAAMGTTPKDERWQFLKSYPCMGLLVIHKS